MFKITCFKITVGFKEITWKDGKLSVYTKIQSKPEMVALCQAPFLSSSLKLYN